MSSTTEIFKLYAADRAERKNHPRLRTPEYTALRGRDKERRDDVERLLNAGAIRTGEEYYYAAWIFNHGGTPYDAWRAHTLAVKADESGHRPARWLAAAAYDRWCMYRGEPQKYGTQYVSDGFRQRLWDVVPETTDQERAEWDVPPLAEQLRKAEEATRKDPHQPKITDDAPQWLKDALKRWGVKIDGKQ
jgi:hypothetical protein